MQSVIFSCAMNNQVSKNDVKSGYIEEYIRFMSSSLAPSSLRLLKIDVTKFYQWFVVHNDEHTSNYLHDIADSYKNMLLKTESDTVISRKMSSILRFINWIGDQSTNLVKTDESKSFLQASRTNIDILSLKYKIAFLFTIILFAVGLLFFFKTSQPRKESMGVRGLNRFVLYIPVISDVLPASLEKAEFKLKIYGSETSTSPIITLSCIAKVTFFDSKPHIYIDSGLGCKQLAHSTGDSTIDLPGYFIDIVVRTIKINDERIYVKSNQAEIYANGNIQSQNNSNTILGRQDESLINSLNNSETKIATFESSIDTRPNINTNMPLSIFEVFDAIDGDVGTISSDRLSKAILNSPVVGVIEGDTLVTSGKTRVSVSGASDGISIGDYVSVGLEPGKVIKASLGYENVIGVALESWPNELNKITTLLIK